MNRRTLSSREILRPGDAYQSAVSGMPKAIPLDWHDRRAGSFPGFKFSRPAGEEDDLARMVKQTKRARLRTRLGKLEALQAQLSAARRRETLARKQVLRLTDTITRLARQQASETFEKELQP